MKSTHSTHVKRWIGRFRAPHAAVGEQVSLPGFEILPGTNRVALVGISPITLDEVVRAMRQGDAEAVFRFIKAESATLVEDGTRATVLAFAASPLRRLSCGRVQIDTGPLAGHAVWTLIVERSPSPDPRPNAGAAATVPETAGDGRNAFSGPKTDKADTPPSRTRTHARGENWPAVPDAAPKAHKAHTSTRT